MQLIRLISITLCILLAGCSGGKDTGTPGDGTIGTGSALDALPPSDTSLSIVDGCRLTGELYGAIEGKIAWQSADLSCEGMPRPGGAGARLRFAGSHPSGEGTLAIIIALPAHARDSVSESIDSRITMIEEGSGRFFAANESGSCWVDVLDVTSLDEDRELTSGRLYCIRPLAEVNGSSSLTIPELEFSGLVDWNAS